MTTKEVRDRRLSSAHDNKRQSLSEPLAACGELPVQSPRGEMPLRASESTGPGFSMIGLVFAVRMRRGSGRGPLIDNEPGGRAASAA